MQDLMQLPIGIIAALLGILVGGVINVLSDDLPPEEWHIKPPHYPDGTPRPTIAWVGLTAFLTGNRTSSTGSKLSWRHPLVEIVTAGLFVYVALAYPLSARTFFWMGDLAILILITVIDLEHRLILFIVIIPAAIFALIGAAVAGPEISMQITFLDYVIGGVAGFVFFFLMYLGGILFNNVAANARGQEMEEVAFGYGDVMLATLSGLILGWQALIFAVFFAVFAGAAGALLYLLAQFAARRKYEMFTALPYGQYIVLGTIIMMLWRAPVITFIHNIS
jgi:leader peptidase (prepilin peptidase)/N-methyltransferase